MTDATRVRRRAERPAGPPAPRPAAEPAPTTDCRCRRLVLGKLQPRGGPVLVVTFRAPRPGADAEVVQVELRHWGGRDGCWMRVEHLDPKTWGRW